MFHWIFFPSEFQENFQVWKKMSNGGRVFHSLHRLLAKGPSHAIPRKKSLAAIMRPTFSATRLHPSLANKGKDLLKNSIWSKIHWSWSAVITILPPPWAMTSFHTHCMTCSRLSGKKGIKFVLSVLYKTNRFSRFYNLILIYSASAQRNKRQKPDFPYEKVKGGGTC